MPQRRPLTNNGVSTVTITTTKRSQAQMAADGRYESKRATLPRFGGRCSIEEKALLSSMAESSGSSEKDVIFKALRFFEENHKNSVDVSDVQ